MTEIQYGVRHQDSVILWFDSKNAAETQIHLSGPGVYLVAREVGEPYEVKELPTAPGSVIRAKLKVWDGERLLMRADRDGFEWVGQVSRTGSNAWLDNEIESWTLVFDAGATV